MKKLVNQIKQKIGDAFNRLSPKQKIGFVVGLFTVFVVVDILFIWHSLKESPETIRMEHINPLPIPKLQEILPTQPKMIDYEKPTGAK